MYQIDKFTLRNVLVLSAGEYADTPALSMTGGKAYTFSDVYSLASKLASKLAAEAKIEKGSRVALIGENCPEWGITYLAVTAMGATIVPVLTEFTADQIGNILMHAECKAAVFSKKSREKIRKIEGLYTLPLEDIPNLASPSTERVFQFPEVSEEDLAAIIYTSGTTGNSKGVMLSNGNIVSNAHATRTIIRMHPGDRLLSILPLAHTYECTLGFVGGFMQGAANFYLDKPPTATVLLPALQKVRPTIMLSVPLIMEKIYRASVLPKLEAKKLYAKPFFRKLFNRIAGKKLKKLFGGRLRFFGIGGAALAPDVEQFLLEAKFPYAIGYGLTETSPLVAGCAPFKTFLRSTGPALAGVQIRLAPAESGTGEGEIQVKGPNVMRGYFKDPAKTAEVFTPDGWFKTGDLGQMDEKNRLFIRGRLKTMILGPSGENIYPEEIEALINQSNFVQESLVYGEPSGGLIALVMLKPEALERLAEDVKQMTSSMGDQAKDMARDAETRAREILEGLRKDVNGKLAAFSRISKVNIQSEPFEKTPTQKIKRHFYPGGDKKQPPQPKA
jgi:long-chain acyl-CoA synthetase